MDGRSEERERTGGDGAAGRVDVHGDGLFGAVGLEPEQLCHNGGGDCVVDRAIEANNALLVEGQVSGCNRQWRGLKEAHLEELGEDVVLEFSSATGSEGTSVGMGRRRGVTNMSSSRQTAAR
jgi:hypothetical protein